MARLRRSGAPTTLGAWGLTMALALGSIDSINGSGAGARAGAPARRLQAPAAPAPADPTVAAVITLTNDARRSAGVAPVVEDARIDAAAAAHSADQAARATMTHTGSTGSTAGQRITSAGFVWRTWGENVAAGQRSPTDVVQAWLNSAGHRAIMLNPAFTGIGVGVAAGPNGILYWTMDLAA